MVDTLVILSNLVMAAKTLFLHCPTLQVMSHWSNGLCHILGYYISPVIFGAFILNFQIRKISFNKLQHFIKIDLDASPIVQLKTLTICLLLRHGGHSGDPVKTGDGRQDLVPPLPRPACMSHWSN